MKKSALLYLIAISFILSIEASLASARDTLKFYSGEVIVVASPESNNVRFSDSRIIISSIPNVDYFSASELFSRANIGNTFKNSRNETILNIRGFDRKQIAVFFDGVPLNAPNDGFADIDIIPSSVLALISVSKASVSNSYGVNTMGGAVNLVSDEIFEPLRLNAKMLYGTTSGVEFSGGGKIGDFSWLLGADYSFSDGFSPAKYNSNVNINESADDKRINSEFNKHSIFAKVSYNLFNTSNISLNFLKSDGKRNVPINVYSNRKRYWKFTDLTNEIVSLTIDNKIFDYFTLRANAHLSMMYNKLRSFDDSTYTTQKARSSFNSVFDDYTAGVSISGIYSITNKFTSVAMASYKKDNHSSQSNTGDKFKDYSSSYLSFGLDNRLQVNSFSFFLSASYDVLHPLQADTIKSSDQLRGKSDAFNYSAGLEYFTDKFGVFYTSISERTRFPTLKELYSEFMGRNEPNPNLKPEKVLTAEIGIRNIILNEFLFASNIFVSQLNDLIQYFPMPEGKRMFDNVGKAIISGVEFNIARDFKYIGLCLDYKYLYIKDANSDTTKFEDRPQNILSFNIYSILPYNIRFDMFNRFISERYSATFDTGELKSLEGYYLLDMRIEHKIIDNLYIYANANNLTNTYYETVHGFPSEGRNFSIGIRYSYK